jgi:hypothetical protein
MPKPIRAWPGLLALALVCNGCGRDAGSSTGGHLDAGTDAGGDADGDSDADTDTDGDTDTDTGTSEDTDDELICGDIDVWFCDPPDGGNPDTSCTPESNCCGHPGPPGDYAHEFGAVECWASWNTQEPPELGTRKCNVSCDFSAAEATCECSDCFWQWSDIPG